MDGEQDVLGKIKLAVDQKIKDLENCEVRDEKAIESAYIIKKMVGCKGYMAKLTVEQAGYLFKYCDFPEEKWKEYYCNAMFETSQQGKYIYIDPESLECPTKNGASFNA